MHLLRYTLNVLLLVLALVSVPCRADLAAAVEYYNGKLDHFFVTADPVEIEALDSGKFSDWVRTGLDFGVFTTGTPLPGSTPVCRFYGNPAFGLDSHFYSGSPSECADVLAKWPDHWSLESSEVFRVLPAGSVSPCRTDPQLPLYRLFNQRADVNHRFTTRKAVADAMVAKGWILEGYGNPPVAMCVYPTPRPPDPPRCELLSDNSYDPVATETIRLLAYCYGQPTSFVWTNCHSTGEVCYATRATPGMETYSVVAANAGGYSAPATLTLPWTARGPRCRIAIRTLMPTAGIAEALVASCDGNPSDFFWGNCAAALDTCIAASAVPGQQVYSLSASNVWGHGPSTTVTFDWQFATPVCSVRRDYVSDFVELLTATCDKPASSYVWTNCDSSASTCAASSSVAGEITYTVSGVNEHGAGPPAAITVGWWGKQPVCTITASTVNSPVGREVVLTALCSDNPYMYVWSDCNPTQAGVNTCRFTRTEPGTVSAWVYASNQRGSSEAARITIVFY